MRDLDVWLKALVANDHSLGEEVERARDRVAAPPPRGGTRGASRDAAAVADPVSLRTIVMRVGRPVLAIIDAAAELTFPDSESEVWRARLQAAAAQIRRAARAVGRIDVVGHPQLRYVGTGWLVDHQIVLTNRHVAREFARRDGRRFAFAQGIDGTAMSSSIDFLEEQGRDAERRFGVTEILHIEPDEGPDLAFLRVEGAAHHHRLSAPIPLAEDRPSRDQQIATIGYPARDSRVPDDQLVHHIFGDVYDKKRLAPGQVTDVRDAVLLHDCSTLGGNSGSVLLDLASGKAVGLHFAGRFLDANFAVPSHVIAARLAAVKRGVQARPRPSHVAVPSPAPGPPTSVPHQVVAPAAPVHEVLVEGVPADYENREGYRPDFLGIPVPLPVVVDDSDLLTYPWQGQTETELRYQHFSVAMSRARRLCRWSAVNIDGSAPRRFKRPEWRLDPRIPQAQQIRDECYGPEPQFSRGHMTRREDPVWGDSGLAQQGNSDSMHVTNTVPQMQPFNAGIWLTLENYALEHARSDAMRISVFTGPFLLDDDPVRDGVMIPQSFWKVIAFIHDDTGALCATGYIMSQEAFLHDEEFVFSQHRTSQVRIAFIEQKSGLLFGPLTALDPLHEDEEGVETTLTDPAQIRFR